MPHVSRLTSHVSRLINNRTFTYLIYALIFCYSLILSKLLSHGGGHFIFVALLFIVLARYKLVFNLCIIYSALLATIFSPCMIYGEINSNLALNFLIADKSIASDFINALPIKLFASVIFIWISTILLIKFRNLILLRNPKIYPIYWVIVAGHMFAYPPIHSYIKSEMQGGSMEFKFTDFLYKSANFLIKDTVNIRTAYQGALMELDKQALILNAQPNWNVQITVPDFNTYIVVIGESARRDALHAYGFDVENTPFLSNRPRIQFNNYIAVGGDTITSLSNTLVLNYHLNSNFGNNIVDLANLAGFKTYWLSDQNEVGIFDSVISGIGKKADYWHFLNFSNPRQAIFNDKLLIPHIAQALQDENVAKKVIFVHLYGSHMPFCNRTQGKHDNFHVNKKLSCYVQSIKQTDDLLKDIYHLLQQHKQQTSKEWAMVYFSDHGLAANRIGKTIWHGQKHKTNYEVPFIILNSKLTEKTFINAQRGGLNFFDFFAEWIGVKDNLILNECNFISEEICPNSTVVIHGNKQVDFYSLEDEKENYFR